MKQFFKVFRFEFLNYVKDKVFIILTVILLLGISITLFFPRFKNNMNISFGKNKEKPTITIIDKTPKKDMVQYFTSALENYTIKSDDATIDEAKKLAMDSDDNTVIIITSPLKYKYIVKNKGLYDETSALINNLLLSKYKNEYLLSSGLTGEQLTEFNTAEVFAETVVVGKDQTESFFYTYALMLLLYMSVLMYGQFVAQSVVLEKSSRAMELLITSADPKSLIFGKILGAGLAGLSQLMVILIWSFGCYKINSSYWSGNFAVSSLFNITPSLICYTALFFVLGFLLYSFVFGAMASLATKMEEISTLTMPAIFLMVISFIATIASVSSGNVNNGLLKALSFIPFSSPMAMFARITMNTAAVWEIVLSVAILIISNFIIGYLAVAIYRVGILMYGKPPKLNELIRTLKNK